MAICPFAVWEPLSRSTPSMDPTCVVVHSNAGTSGDLHGWWESNPDGLMSHFQIGIDGTIWQYVDTTREAYANVDANRYGISIETANNPGFGAMPAFDQDRWQGAQLASLVRLIQWIGLTHPSIPMAWCTDGRHGIGAHDEFAYWTTPGHQCPGAARATQLRDEIVPSLSRPAPSAPVPEEDDDMNRADTIALLRAPEFSQAKTRAEVEALAKQVQEIRDEQKATNLMLLKVTKLLEGDTAK